MLLLPLMVAGCGALGGNDEETPTPEPQPTATLPPFSSPAASPASQQQTPPANIDLSSPAGAATPATGVGATPPAGPGTPVATPAGVAGVGAATPAPASDGTTGASAAAGTPPAPATPGAGTPASGAPVVVTSCEPDNVPAFSGDNPAYLVREDLNFRAGPGEDCGTLGEPLGAGVAVTVTSDPVVREGEEGQEWVRIEVDGVTGWVAVDFLEPAG